MKISVIVSTYNRCGSLKGIIQSLIDQEQDGTFDYEIIIVDNNSKDKTKEAVEPFIGKNASQIRYVFEPKRGLSNARNAGINNAKGEILAFTDDDVLVDKNWLLNIARFSLRHDFDALGGKVLPLYPENTPQWIKDCKDVLTGPIVSYDFGETIQLYNGTIPPFIGANMAIKRKTFEDLGGFKPNIGSGKGTTGEDTEFFHRLKKANKIIYYDPELLILHPVDKSRMNLKYFAKWHVSHGKYLILKHKEDKNLVFIFGVPRYLFREVIGFLWRMVKSIKNKRSFIEAWCGLFGRVGMIYGYCKIKGKYTNNNFSWNS